MRTLAAVFVTAALALPVPAQCLFTSFQSSSYGSPCSPVFPLNAPVLSARFDQPNCTVYLQINAFSGCCNTFVSGHVLALGTGPASIPLPQIGPGCTLLVAPFAFLFQAGSGSNLFPLTVPATLPPPLGFNAQGAVMYFTTIGLTTDLALTQGLTVSMS